MPTNYPKKPPSTQISIYGHPLPTDNLIEYIVNADHNIDELIKDLRYVKDRLNQTPTDNHQDYKHFLTEMLKISNLKVRRPWYANNFPFMRHHNSISIDPATLLPADKTSEPKRQLLYTMPLTVGHYVATCRDDDAQNYLDLLHNILDDTSNRELTNDNAYLKISFLKNVFYSAFYYLLSFFSQDRAIVREQRKLACGFVFKQLMTQTHKGAGLTMGPLLVLSRKNSQTIQQYLSLVAKLLKDPNFQAYLQDETDQLKHKNTGAWLDDHGHIRLQNYTNIDPSNPYHMILWALGAIHLDNEYTQPNATIALTIGVMAQYADSETMEQLFNLLQIIIDKTNSLGFDLLRNPINPAENSNTLGHIIAQNQDSHVFNQFLHCLTNLDASHHRAILQATNDDGQTIGHVITNDETMKVYVYLDHLNTLSNDNLYTILCIQDQNNDSLGHIIAQDYSDECLDYYLGLVESLMHCKQYYNLFTKQNNTHQTVGHLIAKHHSDEHTQRFLNLVSNRLYSHQISHILQLQSKHKNTLGRIIAYQTHQSIANLNHYLLLANQHLDNKAYASIKQDIVNVKSSVVRKFIVPQKFCPTQAKNAMDKYTLLGDIIQTKSSIFDFFEKDYITEIQQALGDTAQLPQQITDERNHEYDSEAFNHSTRPGQILYQSSPLLHSPNDSNKPLRKQSADPNSAMSIVELPTCNPPQTAQNTANHQPSNSQPQNSSLTTAISSNSITSEHNLNDSQDEAAQPPQSQNSSRRLKRDSQGFPEGTFNIPPKENNEYPPPPERQSIELQEIRRDKGYN